MTYINPISKVISKTRAKSDTPKITQPKIAIGEVLKVYVNGPEAGTIRYRYENTTGASVDGAQNTALPLLANIRLYPVAAEKVMLFFLGNVYYLPLNLWNNPIANYSSPIYESTLREQSVDLAKMLANNETFRVGKKVHVVTAVNEGDIIFEGRYGQSIKFGSTVKVNDAPRTPYSTAATSKNGDPITIIRNSGDAPYEAPTTDTTATYMCSTQALYMDAGTDGFDGIVGSWCTININSTDYEYAAQPSVESVEDEQSSFQNNTVTTTQPSNTATNSYTPPSATVESLEKIPGTYQSYVSGIPQGTVELSVIDGCPVATKIADQYLKLKAAAAQSGVTVQLNSGFRANDDIQMPDGSIKQGQKSLYQQYLNGGNLAAKPGYSNHQNGSAIDINVTNTNTYQWLVQNAIKFGFIRGVASERWHWEYKPTATTIYAKVPKSHPTWDNFDTGMV